MFGQRAKKLAIYATGTDLGLVRALTIYSGSDAGNPLHSLRQRVATICCGSKPDRTPYPADEVAALSRAKGQRIPLVLVPKPRRRFLSRSLDPRKEARVVLKAIIEPFVFRLKARRSPQRYVRVAPR